ncbi:MAG: hypothetical protein QXP81_11045 [Nitrososphaerota archaeon]
MVILVAGALALLYVVQEGVRVWQRYGLIEEAPTILPKIDVKPLITTSTAIVAATALITLLVLHVLRSRRVLGVLPLSALTRHAIILGPNWLRPSWRTRRSVGASRLLSPGGVGGNRERKDDGG